MKSRTISIEAELKAIYQNLDAGSQERHQNLEEALRTANIKIQLRELVEKKMMTLERLVLQKTQTSPAIEMNSTLSRLPTYLALIDRILQMHQDHHKPCEVYHHPSPPKSTNEILKLQTRVQELAQQVLLAEGQKNDLKIQRVRQEELLRNEINVLTLRCEQQKDMLVELTNAVDLHTNQVASIMNDSNSYKATIVALENQRREHEQIVLEMKAKERLLTNKHDHELEILRCEIAQYKENMHIIQHRLDQVMAQSFDYKKFIQTITEEDDSIRHQLEKMIESQLGIVDYSNIGVTCLKTGSTLAKFINAIQDKMKTQKFESLQQTSVKDQVKDLTNEMETERRNNQLQMNILHSEIEELHVGFRTMERLASDRLDTMEQLHVELEEIKAKYQLFTENQHQIEQSLYQEIQCHLDSIEQLKAEKRQLIQKSHRDEAETYEDVLKQEFQVMRKAYELKAKQAQEHIEMQEKAHFRQIQELIRKHKDERIIDEMKTNKLLCALKEKY
ncbi:hypothetical protein THRCLA_08823 [Thraustotheca clavata]|uniref:Uncharacterized protein n=1 Tax=Thraustotheca clavata TaxID=74557 RepID=A0A1V9Z1V4_9STRA|nr:hypothetical protein THRCLA_08823 [Thraustotheca clavata]